LLKWKRLLLSLTGSEMIIDSKCVTAFFNNADRTLSISSLYVYVHVHGGGANTRGICALGTWLQLGVGPEGCDTLPYKGSGHHPWRNF